METSVAEQPRGKGHTLRSLKLELGFQHRSIHFTSSCAFCCFVSGWPPSREGWHMVLSGFGILKKKKMHPGAETGPHICKVTTLPIEPSPLPQGPPWANTMKKHQQVSRSQRRNEGVGCHQLRVWVQETWLREDWETGKDGLGTTDMLKTVAPLDPFTFLFPGQLGLCDLACSAGIS